MSTQTRCDCGFVSTPTTPAYALRALERHSCERWQAISARQARGRARRDRVDRTPKCCRHEHPHTHGTRACYVLDRCRCTPCAKANAAAELTRVKQTAYGRWQPYVDAGPARAHLASLSSEGLGLKRVAVLSGISHGALSKLVYGDPSRGRGPSKRIRPATERAILAVNARLDDLGATVRVDATGTRRRLQALIALGWSMSELARRLGRLPSNFVQVLTREQCNALTAREVRALYEQMRSTRPPERTPLERAVASRARNYAAARGWQPPMWWDDADLDDPAAESGDLDQVEVVDDVAIERFVGGEDVPLTRTERLEAAVRLVLTGVSVSRAAARAQVRPDRVRSRLDEASQGIESPAEQVAS